MRIIPRLDIKNEWVIKGIHLEGLRKVGDPKVLAKKYYEDGADEIILMDAVASLYDRNSLFDLISEICENVFVPIVVGGGLRTVGDVESALSSGADKVALNTALIKNPNLVDEISIRFGSQCLIGSIEAIKKGNSWECYVDNGREPTGLDAKKWASEMIERGCGELMITSVDCEGTKSGLDIELTKHISSITGANIIASGGFGSRDHFQEISTVEGVSGLAIASCLHYNIFSISEIKAF